MIKNEWDEWKAKAEAAIAKKVPPPIPAKTPRKEIFHRLITEEELILLKALQGASFGRNGQATRFVQRYENATKETKITERQAWYIRVLAYKYRRQLDIEPVRPVGYE